VLSLYVGLLTELIPMSCCCLVVSLLTELIHGSCCGCGVDFRLCLFRSLGVEVFMAALFQGSAAPVAYEVDWAYSRVTLIYSDKGVGLLTELIQGGHFSFCERGRDLLTELFQRSVHVVLTSGSNGLLCLRTHLETKRLKLD